MIPEVTVLVDENPNYDTDIDTDTQDRVFLPVSYTHLDVYKRQRAGGIRSVSAPCILTHGVLNALSVFAPEPDYKTRCVIFRIRIVLAAAYAAFLLRCLPPLTSGGSCVRMEKNTEGD